MAQIFLNNCYATLAQAITASDTQIELSGMNGFPLSLGAGDFFLLTIYADTTRYGENIEVVKVTGLSDSTLTVERGVEGDAAAHEALERVEARLTAGTVDGKADQSSVSELWDAVGTKVEQSYLDDVSQALAGKAEQTDVVELWNAVADKADLSNVDELWQFAGNKRDQSDTSFTTYDLNSNNTTSVLNLAASQVFRISATSNRTISFSNAPGAGRAMTVVVHLHNASLSSRSITWPAAIRWNEGSAPDLDGIRATIILLWTGSEWIGSLGALS